MAEEFEDLDRTPAADGDAAEETPETERSFLQGSSSDHVAQMPGYDKMGGDQDEILFEIEDRPPYPWQIAAWKRDHGLRAEDPLPADAPAPLQGEGKLGAFPAVTDYLAWAHKVFHRALGRRTRYRDFLFSDLLIPFMVEGLRGDKPAGVLVRERLRVFITEEMFPLAQQQFSRKAREEPRIEVRYLERGRASSSVYDRLAERKAETERREEAARGKR